MKRIAQLVFVATTCSIPGLAEAGWHAKQIDRSGADKPPQESHLFCEAEQLRVDQPDKNSVIIHLGSGTFTMLDHAKKAYFSITLEEMLGMRDRMMQQMKAQLKDMPPEVQKQMEAQMKAVEGTSSAEAQIQLKATGKKETVHGYSCEVYQWTAPDGVGEACIAHKLSVDMKPFIAATAKLGDKLAKLTGGKQGPAAFAMLTMAKQGFPIRTKRSSQVGGNTVEITSEITSIEAMKIDGAKFQVPKDYARQDMGQMMGGGAPGSGPAGPRPGSR